MKYEMTDAFTALNLHYENKPLTFQGTACGSDDMHFTVMQDGKAIAYFNLVPFPHSYGLMISYGVTVNDAYRGKGLGNLLHNARLTVLKKMGIRRVFCTVNESNEPELAILRRYNWTRLDYTDSQHIAALWVKALR